jgi:hypothetical protein
MAATAALVCVKARDTGPPMDLCERPEKREVSQILVSHRFRRRRRAIAACLVLSAMFHYGVTRAGLSRSCDLSIDASPSARCSRCR